MVYHYTTIETFYNMLASYKESEDKKHLVFWASNALNLNDSEELFLRADDILSVIRKIEERKENLKIPSHKKLSTICDQWWVPYLTSEHFKDDLNICNKDMEYTPYTISFSRQRDMLLMWTMYANNGNGICLAFEENKLIDNQLSFLPIADNVIYGNNSKMYTKVVRKLFNLYKKEILKENVINAIYQKKRLYIITMLWCIAPFIKNEAFKDEKEFRIAFYKDKSFSSKVYKRLTGRMNEINYVKVNIPLDSLNHIIIGPCADFTRTKDLLVENMKSCNIIRDYDNGFITQSKVPFRMY